MPRELDVTDEQAWTRFRRRHQLAAFRLQWLARRYNESEGRVVPEHERERPEAVYMFRRWCVGVAESEVTLLPGGRAVIRHPVSQRDRTVEGRWRLSASGEPVITEYTVSATAPHPIGWVASITREMSALYLALSRRSKEPTGKRPEAPTPGKPGDIEFYRYVVAEYDALVRAGHPTPAKELAARLKAEPATVRSWVLRGRRYLNREGTERVKHP
jgi:hypothetical protein